jgi:hypothetical protein
MRPLPARGACGDSRPEGCSCGVVFSMATDGPVMTATIGEWGDSWPDIRLTVKAIILSSIFITSKNQARLLRVKVLHP